jgi:hypothetical protein
MRRTDDHKLVNEAAISMCCQPGDDPTPVMGHECARLMPQGLHQACNVICKSVNPVVALSLQMMPLCESDCNLQDTQQTATCASVLCLLVFVKKLAAVCVTSSTLHSMIVSKPVTRRFASEHGAYVSSQ